MIRSFPSYRTQNLSSLHSLRKSLVRYHTLRKPVNMSIHDAKVISSELLNNEDSRWAKLKLLTYKDPHGKQHTYETSERATRAKGGELDGVGIIATIHRPDGPHIILEKQFRPPLNKVVIEIPAGLVESLDTAEETAIRELKEETGYVGTVSKVSPVMFNDPGFCNTNLVIVYMDVDANLPENQNPVHEREATEFMEVFTVPIANLYDECSKLEKEGYAIDARVGTLADGIALAQRLKL